MGGETAAAAGEVVAGVEEVAAQTGAGAEVEGEVAEGEREAEVEAEVEVEVGVEAPVLAAKLQECSLIITVTLPTLTLAMAPTLPRSPKPYPSPLTLALALPLTKLQEWFGAAETPRVGPRGATLPVLLHLLTPAGRPAAITSDLRSFWAGPYSQARARDRGLG